MPLSTYVFDLTTYEVHILHITTIVLIVIMAFVMAFFFFLIVWFVGSVIRFLIDLILGSLISFWLEREAAFRRLICGTAVLWRLIGLIWLPVAIIKCGSKRHAILLRALWLKT